MGLSFLRGLVASVNPCAFVLLPTYLMYFLGMSGARPGDQRATVRRALAVSAAVSSGFMGVFVVAGLLSRYVTSWIEANAKYATVGIGVVFVVVGIAMLAGWHVPVLTPRLGTVPHLGDDRAGLIAMVGYGVAYGISSISCTLVLFLPSLFATGSGGPVVQVIAYGAGMALVVTSLTVALAVANTSILRALRVGSQHLQRLAGALVVLSGLYLIYYFWIVDVGERSTPVTDAVDRVRGWLVATLQGSWQLVAIVLAAVVAWAIVFVWGRRRSVDGRSGRADDSDSATTVP